MEKINTDWAKGILCRNITIHGYCKYEGKGCSFNHDTNGKNSSNDITSHVNGLNLSGSRPVSSASSTSLPQIESSGSTKKKFDPASSSAFTPGSALGSTSSMQPLKNNNKFAALSPNLSDIPSFIPGSDSDAVSATPRQFNIDSPSFQSSRQQSPVLQNTYADQQIPSTLSSTTQSTGIHSPINPYAPSSLEVNSYPAINQPQDYLFQQTAYPLQYHLYAPAPPPHLQIPLRANEQNAESLFLPNELREILTKKNEDTLKTLAHSTLPELVGAYYDLVPLDNSVEKNEKTYGYQSSLFKAFSNVDGRAYTLRRIEDVKISKDMSIATINQWKRLNHSNIAKVADAFTSRAFGDNSLIVVYDYYPSSRTLLEHHYSSAFGKPYPITPDLIWSYLVQLSAGIAAVHDRNLAVRSISLQKVIVTSKTRIRLSDIGVFDILHYSEDSTLERLEKLQLEDLTKLGKLILTLASAKLSASLRSLPELELISKLEVEDELKSTLSYLLSDSSKRSIHELQRLIVPKAFKELNRLEVSADYYESQLTREVENARLVRLLSKISFILDRPGPDNQKYWSQAGERYPIKLFHQYVFNQVDERGKAVLDLSHVLRCLNKLDVGIDEKLLLVSGDEQSCLIVSYKELKDMIERSFRELTKD